MRRESSCLDYFLSLLSLIFGVAYKKEQIPLSLYYFPTTPYQLAHNFLSPGIFILTLSKASIRYLYPFIPNNKLEKNAHYLLIWHSGTIDENFWYLSIL